MEINLHHIATTLRLLQLSDSALPVGAFSFSNTLESAADAGIIGDEYSLEQYTQEVVRMAAFTDGVAALTTWQAAKEGNYEAVTATDKALFCSKPNDESRLMSQRMGRKLAELMTPLIREEPLIRWSEDIHRHLVDGTYAVTQAIIAQICGIGRQELFCSICYGAASITLGAALRTMRTTHLATQGILFRMAHIIEPLYAEAAIMRLDEMNSFSPQCDIMAALHEKGTKRLFMN